MTDITPLSIKEKINLLKQYAKTLDLNVLIYTNHVTQIMFIVSREPKKVDFVITIANAFNKSYNDIKRELKLESDMLKLMGEI